DVGQQRRKLARIVEGETQHRARPMGVAAAHLARRLFQHQHARGAVLVRGYRGGERRVAGSDDDDVIIVHGRYCSPDGAKRNPGFSPAFRFAPCGLRRYGASVTLKSRNSTAVGSLPSELARKPARTLPLGNGERNLASWSSFTNMVTAWFLVTTRSTFSSPSPCLNERTAAVGVTLCQARSVQWLT